MSTSSTTSSPSTWSRRTKSPPSPSSSRCSRTSMSSISQQTVTGRARPSPGTSWRPSSPRFRSSGWSSTRSPNRPSGLPQRTPVTSTKTWSTPRRPDASSTACTATRCRRCCGRRSCRNSRRAVCSRWPPASSSSANASGWRSGRQRTGTSPPRSTPARKRHPAVSARGSSVSTATAWPVVATSTPPVR